MKAMSDLLAHLGLTTYRPRDIESDEQVKKIIMVDRRAKVLELVDEPKTIGNGSVEKDASAETAVEDGQT